MANSQIFPSSSYPGNGDISTTPGSPFTTVVGIQTVPFSPAPPLQGQVPVYEVATNEWTPSTTTLLNNDSISVNGVTVSDDYGLSINRIDTEVLVNSPYSPHGFPILAAGTAVNTP
jgi:hypothetical protein